MALNRMLVGVDGSAPSLNALSWALALPDSCQVTAGYAFAPGYAEVSHQQHEALRAEAEEQLAGWCAAADGAGRVSSLVLDGDPDALLALASESSDLLVAGRRGAGEFARLHLGGTVHHFAHHTATPLAIVPGNVNDTPAHRIVIGVDGSPGSSAAVKFCAELASLLGASVVAVYACDPIVEWVLETDPRSWHHSAEIDVHEWVAPIEAAGVPVVVDIDRDIHPVAALCRAIDAESHTLAVVGARGLGGFSGLRLGHVPLQLVHHTDVVVVMVPEESSRRDMD
jgi:nucleotide-binding universal stress UspA family protein